MDKENQIDHEAIVLKSENNEVIVKMIVKSGCANCDIKSACNLSEIEEKIVEVKTSNQSFEKGDRVLVSMKSSQGYKALLLGYLLPFVVLVGFLIIFQDMNFTEGKSALFAFGFLALYYFILYFSRDKLKKSFSYKIKRIQDD